MSTSLGAAEWIYATLKANGTLCADVGGTVSPRIYHDVIPQSAALPAVVYQIMASRDENAVGGRGLTVQQWQVKAVGQGPSYSALRNITDQIDASLNYKFGTATTAGVVVGCSRSEEVMYGESGNGIEYRHLGGIYQIYAAGTA